MLVRVAGRTASALSLVTRIFLYTTLKIHLILATALLMFNLAAQHHAPRWDGGESEKG